jgi:hypothetical protein
MGEQKIRIDIEIGSVQLEPSIIDKYFPNANFSMTHQKLKIEIPKEAEYKPPLNIKCVAEAPLFLYNAFHRDVESFERAVARKITIGSCTINSINDYYVDKKQMKYYCKNSTFI